MSNSSNLPAFLFGKYKGQAISDVIKSDPSYIKWLMSTENLNKGLKVIIENLQYPSIKKPKFSKKLETPEFIDTD